MKVKEFERALAGGKVPPVTVLVGQEEHFKQELIRSIRKAAFPDPSEAELGTVFLETARKGDAEKLTVSRIFEELRTLPLLSEAKLVVVRNAERVLEEDLDGFAGELGDFLGAGSRTGTLVLHTQGSVTRLVKALQKAGGKSVVTVECKKLYDTKAPWQRGRGPAVSETATWLSGEAKAFGHALSPVDAESIVEKIGGNLTRLHQELDKLSLLAGTGKPLTRELIDASLGPASERTHASFHFTDAVVAGNLPRALTMIQQIFTEGLDMGGDRARVTSPSGIALLLLSALFRRINNLYEGARLISRGQSPEAAAERLGIKGYPAKKFGAEVTRHRLADLEAKIPVFRIAERNLKGGSTLSPQLVLEQTVVQLIEGPKLPVSARPRRESIFR